MNKKWIIFGLLIVGLFGVLALTQPKTSDLDISDINKDVITTANDKNGQIGDHFLGSESPKATVIVYGDYQCSACASHNRKLLDLVTKYPENLAVVFRHHPISGHTSAKAAAAVAEAAGKQGKFWEMHNLLFQNYMVWSADANTRGELFSSYAKQIGLDETKFNNDIEDESVKQKIAFDTALGKAHDLRETPTVVLNGQKLAVEDWSDDEKLYKLIEDNLAPGDAKQ